MIVSFLKVAEKLEGTPMLNVSSAARLLSIAKKIKENLLLPWKIQ